MNALLIPRRRRIRTPFGFSIVALLFYVIDGAIAHSAAFATRPGLFAPAISIDLTLGVTFAYWAFVVRPGFAALRTALPVFVLSVGAAALVLPPGQRDLIQFIRYLGIPLELAAVAMVVLAVRRTQQRLAASGVEMDVPERIRASLGGSSLQSRVADIVAMETSLMFYALASWRRAPFVPAGMLGFSYHKRNSYAAILYTFFLATVVETVAVHFLIRVFAPRVALAVLAVSGMGALWVLGFARSIQLRPIVVSADTLHVRSGMKCAIEIPKRLIAGIEFGRMRTLDKRTPEFIAAAPGQPNVMIELREPVRARGPYGTGRMITRVSLVIDDLVAFQRALDVKPIEATRND
jgi:hypothetical protein